jgi:hypothetical protein
MTRFVGSKRSAAYLPGIRKARCTIPWVAVSETLAGQLANAIVWRASAYAIAREERRQPEHLKDEGRRGDEDSARGQTDDQ